MSNAPVDGKSVARANATSLTITTVEPEPLAPVKEKVIEPVEPLPPETLPTILLTDDRLAAVYAMLDLQNKTPVLYYKRSEQKLYVYNAIGKSKITINPQRFINNYEYFKRRSLGG